MINIWPFNKHNKHKTNNSVFTIKSKHRSILAIIGASFISLLTLGGAGASIAMAVDKYSLSAEYSDSYNIRIELDTSMKNEDPFVGVSSDPNFHMSMTGLDLNQMTINSANAYSQYLFDRGISDFSVYPEYIPANGLIPAKAYLNAVIPNQKGYNRITKENELMPQENIMMNFSESSRISMVMDLTTGSGNGATHFISIIPQEKLVSSSNKISVDSNTPSKVDIDNTNLVRDLSNNGGATWKDLRDSTSWFAGDKNESQIFFIRNLSGLINRMNFILQVVNHSTTEYNQPWSFLSQSEFDWANKFKEEDPNTHQPWYSEPDKILFGDFSSNVYDYAAFTGTSWQQPAPATSQLTNWATGIRMIDQLGPNDTNSPSVSSMANWMKPYVLGVATSATDSTISNSIKNYIPDKNPKNSKEDANGNWLTIPMSSKFEAQAIVDNYNTYSLALPIKSFSGNRNESTGDQSRDPNNRVTYQPIKDGLPVGSQYTPLEFNDETEAIQGIVPYLKDTATHKMPPSLVGNVFGSTAILGAIIALASIILLIGILVSVLYRIPGVFGFGTILCSLSLTLLIMLITGYALSLGLIAGLFAGLIIGVISMFAIMERIKKRYQDGIGFDSSFKSGTKKGILPVIDLHAILLLCGICFIYFNRLQLEIFGVTIVFISLLSFVFNVFLWNSINWIFFSNKINMARHGLAFSFLKVSHTKTQHDNTFHFDSSFHVKRDLKWFNVFGKKEIILSSLLLVVATIGIIILFTTGVHTSYVFYGGTRLVVPENYNGAWQIPTNWSEHFFKDGYWYYLYDYNVAFDQGASTAGVLFQSISSAAITSYVKMAVNSALIASGLICAYTFIRLNWIAVIPVFVGLVTTPLLTIAILSICQVFFDINIVLSLNLLYVINAFFVINVISNISSTGIRSKMFNINELTRVLNYELKNQLHYFLYIVVSIVGMLFVSTLFSSTTLFWFWLPILIGLIIIIIITFTIVPTLLSFFIRIRYKYWSANVIDNSNSQRWKSYDIVDEQLIDGINKTKKKIR